MVRSRVANSSVNPQSAQTRARSHCLRIGVTKYFRSRRETKVCFHSRLNRPHFEHEGGTRFGGGVLSCIVFWMAAGDLKDGLALPRHAALLRRRRSILLHTTPRTQSTKRPRRSHPPRHNSQSFAPRLIYL